MFVVVICCITCSGRVSVYIFVVFGSFFGGGQTFAFCKQSPNELLGKLQIVDAI